MHKSRSETAQLCIFGVSNELRVVGGFFVNFAGCFHMLGNVFPPARMFLSFPQTEFQSNKGQIRAIPFLLANPAIPPMIQWLQNSLGT